jgi:hypothetical protein
MIFKVSNNLFVVEDRIISYETEVASIDGDSINELGKFSRTTTKHIQKVSTLLGKRIIHALSKTKPDFYKHEMGIRIDYSNCVSVKATGLIFERIKKGANLEIAIASLKNELPKKDWALLLPYVDTKIIKGANMLGRFGVFK